MLSGSGKNTPDSPESRTSASTARSIPCLADQREADEEVIGGEEDDQRAGQETRCARAGEETKSNDGSRDVQRSLVPAAVIHRRLGDDHHRPGCFDSLRCRDRR